MKTKEQVQQELNTYLTKTSQHVFVSGDNKNFLRVVETTTINGEKIWFSIWLDENLEPKSIDRSVDVSRYEDPNAKCWVKHSFFLNREMKSVKLKKKTQCIADALIPFIPAGTFDGEWEVVVFEDEQINAFALPGGKIGVYTGILNVAKTPDQLASVMGHEIGHVIAEHGSGSHN